MGGREQSRLHHMGHGLGIEARGGYTKPVMQPRIKEERSVQEGETGPALLACFHS